MRRSKLFILLLALLLCAVIASALAESAWGTLWNSGCDLLFHTDNVTVDGEAVFSLDGERFKTAKLHYVQDGYKSLNDWKVFTPKADGNDRKTGWTVIADDEGCYYVMDMFYPGTYRTGSDGMQNSLLRRSIQLDALIDLGGIVMGQIDPLLPEGALTVKEKDGGKAVHIALNADEIPALAASALNLGANFLSDRWFSYTHDRCRDSEYGGVDFDSYVTITQALTDGTVRWNIRNVDAEFVLDAQDHLSAVSGSVSVDSVFFDGTIRAVTVEFSAQITNRGTSRVEDFDPDEYHVVPQWTAVSGFMEETEKEYWCSRAADAFEKQGFNVDAAAWYTVQAAQKGVFVLIANPDGEEKYCAFKEDGGLIILEPLSKPWLDAQDGGEAAPDLADKAKDYIRSFIADANPALSEGLGELTLLYKTELEDGTVYLTFQDADKTDALFVVQAAPTLRTVCFYARN